MGGMGQGGGSTEPDFVASISPTLETSIVTDGDMELAGVANWYDNGTPTTKEKSTAQKHGGSQSLHIISDAAAEGAVNYNNTATVHKWHFISAWAYVVAGDLHVTQSFGLGVAKTLTAAAWTQLIGADICSGANPRFIARANTVAVSEFYIDDVVVNPLTMASCFANPRTGGALDTVSANVTSIQQCRIGVAANVDSPTNPQNYVLAVVIKESATTAKAYLYQVSGGVYTAKINGTAITYVDDALVEIRHTATTTYQLYYNGAKVGADQTISDANINANTTYMQFSTYSGNIFTSFTLAAGS